MRIYRPQFGILNKIAKVKDMTSRQKIILVSVLVVVAVILVALGGYFISVYSSSSGERTSNGFTYEIDGKTVTILSYSGSDTTITVPAKIGGRRVAKIAKGAFSSSTATSLVFDDAIAELTLEEECFKGQTTLTYVQLPSALKEIPASAFEDCTKLEHIVIPDGVTFIGDNAFEGCTSLSYTGNDSNNKVITLPSQLTYLGEEAFKDCSKINSVVFGSKLQKISDSAFENCKLLAKINFGSESAVSNIAEKAFYKTAVNVFTLPDSLNTIGDYAFAGITNSSFSKVEIPVNVTQIDSYAFSGCTYLKTVTFAEGSQLKILEEGVFKDCTRLTSVSLPDTLTSIPALAFNGCSDLVEFTIGANVETIGEGAFGGIANGSASTIKFTVAEGNDNFVVVKLDDYYEFNSEQTQTTTKPHYLLMTADKSELLAYIGQFDSTDCVNDQTSSTANSFNFLLSADISSKLKKIGAYAFSGLKADKLCLPNVSEIGKGFISSSSVKTVYFEGGDCTLDEDVFEGVSTLRVLGFRQGTIKDFIDALNDSGNNNITFEDGYTWPD